MKIMEDSQSKINEIIELLKKVALKEGKQIN
jgi:hypothetical protein